MHTSVREKNAVILLKTLGPSHRTQAPGTCALLHISIAITSSAEDAPAGVNNRKQIYHYTHALWRKIFSDVTSLWDMKRLKHLQQSSHVQSFAARITKTVVRLTMSVNQCSWPPGGDAHLSYICFSSSSCFTAMALNMYMWHGNLKLSNGLNRTNKQQTKTLSIHTGYVAGNIVYRRHSYATTVTNK